MDAGFEKINLGSLGGGSWQVAPNCGKLLGGALSPEGETYLKLGRSAIDNSPCSATQTLDMSTGVEYLLTFQASRGRVCH
jgi:hypothetical protein